MLGRQKIAASSSAPRLGRVDTSTGFGNVKSTGRITGARSGGSSQAAKIASTNSRPRKSPTISGGGKLSGHAPLEKEVSKANSPASLHHTIEQLSTLEVTLWSIIEGLNSNVRYVSYFCREYWGTSASVAQVSLDGLSWKDDLKRQVHRSLVLESFGFALASYLCNSTLPEASVTTRSRLRNLFYYLHENCLVMFDLVRRRWFLAAKQAKMETVSAKAPGNLSVDILSRVNRFRCMRKGEHAVALAQHNVMIDNVLRALCKGTVAKQKPLGSRTLSGNRGSTGRGSMSPSASSRRSVDTGKPNIPDVITEMMASATSMERLRPGHVRNMMLKKLQFRPLQNKNDTDSHRPHPDRDSFVRFGSDRFAADAPIIRFEPLPPMMADLDNIPSLPPPKTADTYTLLLDLDETLIHYYENDGPGHYNVRPGMYKFLETMNALGYELVIFTAATQDYADWVVGQIDPKGLIHYRLYRQHALPWGPLFAKDFSRLGRDLDRTLIIDNVQENFMKHPDNGIYINTWYDDMSDTALTNLTPLLEEIITTRARVPDILKKYELQIPRWAGIEPDFAQVTSESYDGDQLCEADNLERERNDSEDAKTFGLTPACQIITTHGGVDATDMNGSKTAREHGRTYGDLRFSDLLAQLNEQQQPQ